MKKFEKITPPIAVTTAHAIYGPIFFIVSYGLYSSSKYTVRFSQTAATDNPIDAPTPSESMVRLGATVHYGTSVLITCCCSRHFWFIWVPTLPGFCTGTISAQLPHFCHNTAPYKSKGKNNIGIGTVENGPQTTSKIAN